MTQLTRAERKRFYEILLKIVCEDPDTDHGFCYYISSVVVKMSRDIQELYSDYIFEDEFIFGHLPELSRLKPKKKFTYDYWFPCTPKGWETRINKLHNIIQKMQYGKY